MPVSRIGRDVRRASSAERRLDRHGRRPTRAPLPGQRVTRGAIAGDGEVAAALDLFEILLADALAGDRQAGGNRAHRTAASNAAALRMRPAAPDS